MARTFDNTRAALLHYDTLRPALDAAWEAAQTNWAILKVEQAEAKALAAVREAFYSDTHDINHHEDCMRVSEKFMRRMAELPAPKE